MAVTLRRILSPNKQAFGVVSDLVTALDCPVCIQDSDGKVLLGDSQVVAASDPATTTFPVEFEGINFGRVVGSERSAPIARLLSHLVRIEHEQRGLGGELLDTYREVNLLYKLSDKLTDSMVLDAVATVALEEARRLLSATDGAVMLLNREADILEAIAVFGQVYSLNTRIRPGQGLIGKIFQGGKGEIVNEAAGDVRFTDDDGQLEAVACAPLKGKQEVIGVLVVGSADPVAYTAADLKRLSTVASQAAPAIENALLYHQQVELTNSYSRFVPREFLDFLGKESIVDVGLGDHVHRDMAILVSDIRRFSTISEKMTPQENFEFINRYLAGVSPIIRKHNGLVVKYMGDGIMALFPGGIEDALQAALDQMEYLKEVNAETMQRGEPPIEIGIGLNTGSIMVGTVGETARMQGDIISDAVNVTSRLEGLSKRYGVGIVISERALATLQDPDKYDIRFLGETQVKGRQESIAVYGVV